MAAGCDFWGVYGVNDCFMHGRIMTVMNLICKIRINKLCYVISISASDVFNGSLKKCTIAMRQHVALLKPR